MNIKIILILDRRIFAWCKNRIKRILWMYETHKIKVGFFLTFRMA